MKKLCRILIIAVAVVVPSSGPVSLSAHAGGSAITASRRCVDLMSDVEAAKATGFTGIKIMRESSPNPETLICSYGGGQGQEFTLRVATGTEYTRTLANWQLMASGAMGEMEAVSGIGKRGLWHPATAALRIDTGHAIIFVVMGGEEGNPSVKGWLEAVARVVASHV
jgi:hypothetical protein